MRIIPTAVLVTTFLAASVNNGWSPGPADLKAPLYGSTSSPAVAVGPSTSSRKTYGHGKGFGPSFRELQSDKNKTAGRTRPGSHHPGAIGRGSGGKGQTSYQSGKPAGQPVGNSAMDRLQGM